MAHIDDEHPEEHTDEEGEGQIPGQPVETAQNIGVDQKIVEGTQHRPEEGEQGTDEPLDVAPEVGIIPQHDLEIFQAEQTRNVFDEGHSNGHQDKQHDLVDDGVRDHLVLFQARQQIQGAQSEAVDGKIGAGAKSGVDPLFVVVYNVAEQQFDDPAEHTAYEEQVGQG